MLDWISRNRSSIQAQFLLYSLALLVPALVFSGLMFLRSAAFERAGMEREIKDVARSVAAAIDRELTARITTLKALASSPSLAEGDLKAFYQQAMAAQEVGGDYFILTNRAGKQIVNTRIPFGDPLPETSADNWEEVFETGKTQVSNLYQGTPSQGTAATGPVFSVSVPVEKRNKILYVLSASIAPERILDILKRETLRAGWVATVTDRAGVVIARSQDSEKFLGRTLPRDRATGAKQHAGLWQTADAVGEPVLRATTYALQSGWFVSTTVPTAIANQPIVRSWALVAVLAVSFGILSALLAFVFGRKISDPVRQLVATAAALGRGDEVRAIETSIQEVHAVGSALATACETRRRMEQSLRDSEDRLRLALASADTGTWDWDLKTGQHTWDQRMRELWGLSPDEPVTYDLFVSALHEADRETTLAAIHRAQDPDDPVEYDVEHRVTRVRDGAERWVAVRGKAHFDDCTPARMTGTARDITDRKRWEDHTHLLMREVTHRSKNLLAVIQAMARQSKVGSRTVADFERRFSGRLQALAASHDLLVQRDWHGVSIGELIKSQLGHYLDQHASQIEIDGQRLIVTPEAAQNIGLAVHELSTNAAKYGALSVPQGKVKVHWTCTGKPPADSRFRMMWVERDGPAVTPPSQTGFGHVVMEQLAARALQGEATLKFKPEGVCWTLEIPAAHVLWDQAKERIKFS
jgi:PAS domain S-box-containing protein